jgi:hypothetical protein
VLLLVTASVLAQLVEPQTLQLPAVLEFDHDGQGVKGFVLYAIRGEDGAQRRIDVGMPIKTKSGRWQLNLPALEKGTWQLELAAYNSAGESPRTPADPRVVTIDPRQIKPPPSPTSPPAAKGASSKPPPGAQKPPPSTQKPPPSPKKKKGAFGKIWGVIVGEDKP